MIGPGKYDAECTAAREATAARAILLIVVDGRKGSGFSVQAPLDVQLRVPSILRDLAAAIERDFRDTMPGPGRDG